MTTITTGCPRCGRVELEPPDITVFKNPHEPRVSYEEAAWYIFDCTGCGYRVVKPAPQNIVLALASVKVATYSVPAEFHDRENSARENPPPPVGYNDLLDLMLELRAADEAEDPLSITRPATTA